MSRAEEIRQRKQRAVVTLPSGNTYEVRRPLYAEIQELVAMPVPGQEREEAGPVVDEHKPDALLWAEAAEVAPAMDRIFRFMATVSLDPVIVLAGEVTDPATQVTRREVEEAGDHMDFLEAVTAAFFRRGARGGATIPESGRGSVD